ncbi:hypothetical protein SBI67_13855 [Mycolicibacterium sp. 120266]|uniref:hypothetical protein n=1 Tax=Mycolicibacterium sp. 120266 TaxID=3090601 RepID=UPI00299D3150|nr:hypothetical protein [Mycolicibacterium sp. 120266]MDX1873209.1 hypothetical protein [Mycolicibacterium sp. 120266]
MTESVVNGPIDDVAPGDVITLDRGTGARTYKVVHKESVDGGFAITVEGDGGATSALELPAGTQVARTLEAKWESTQSPTPHSE